MSCLKLCDGDDCYQTENNSTIYHIDHETAQYLREFCNSWFKSTFDDICSNCIEQTNMDYPGFFEIDGRHDLSIGKRYMDDPSLLE